MGIKKTDQSTSLIKGHLKEIGHRNMKVSCLILAVCRVGVMVKLWDVSGIGLNRLPPVSAVRPEATRA